MASSLLLPRHFFSSGQPLSYNLFCTPTSFHDQLPRHMSVLLCPPVVGLSSQHGLNFLQLLTLVLDCPFLLVDHLGSLQEHFFTSCGQTTLMSTATCSSNSKVCHCGHLMPRSRVSHMTAPASALTCLQVCTSKICLLHAFWRLRAKTTPSFLLLLPFASSNSPFSLARRQRLVLSMLSRGPVPSSTTSSHQSSCNFFSKTRIF